MKIRLISQPFVETDSVYNFLLRAANDPAVTQVDIVVAWARRSALGALENSILAMRSRNVRIRMIVGLDAGGASRQGLTLTEELATEAYVVHTPGSRTFHPKMYVIRAAAATQVIIGSQNLTRGGALENFELGVLIELSPACREDIAFLGQIDRYIEDLLNDVSICKVLTPEFLKFLLSPGSGITISDEDNPASSPWAVGHQEGADSSFGRSRRELMSMQSTSAEIQESGKELSYQPVVERADLPDESIMYRWYKKLPRADAQRLPGSNPSGHMTLTRSGHPIDGATFFRQVFFDTAEWRHEVGREFAMVEFEVDLLGVNLGRHQLRVDYKPSFASNQRNRTSTLRWGDRLSLLLRSEIDISRCFAVLERTLSGEFRLTVTRDLSLPIR